jgi:predicted transcriptional regulator of viral defense system
MSKRSQKDRALELVRKRGTLTARDAGGAGIHPQVLTRLVVDGALVRVARGQYRLADAPVTEGHGLAVAAVAVPEGVVCLLSALAFHEIGTQVPSRVWIAVDPRARGPTLAWPPLRVVRFGGEALTTGVETHLVERVPVRVFSPAKTVADLFKYRNKLGLDVALEALKEVWRARRATADELHRYARVCRVEHVMRPYLQAVIV